MKQSIKAKSALTLRWIWTGILAGAVVIGYFLIPDASALADDACGLGLPPSAPGFAAEQAKRKAEELKHGYQRVCADNLRRYDISFKPMSRVTESLAFPPVDLTRTPFAQYKSVGGMAENMGDTSSRLYRGFERPDGLIVTLFEHDMSADGSNLSRDPELEPERVNGLPARLSVMQAGPGKAISHLSWLQGRRFYELWINANVARSPLRAELFALASSLPQAVPACPNEIPPKKFKLGPDGFPEHEPPPASMTEAEMNALFNQARPCK